MLKLIQISNGNLLTLNARMPAFPRAIRNRCFICAGGRIKKNVLLSMGRTNNTCIQQIGTTTATKWPVFSETS